MLLVHGTKDKNSPVESSRYVQKIFDKKGKEYLKLIEFDGCDHSFRMGRKDKISDVTKLVMTWVRK